MNDLGQQQTFDVPEDEDDKPTSVPPSRSRSRSQADVPPYAQKKGGADPAPRYDPSARGLVDDPPRFSQLDEPEAPRLEEEIGVDPCRWLAFWEKPHKPESWKPKTEAHICRTIIASIQSIKEIEIWRTMNKVHFDDRSQVRQWLDARERALQRKQE